MSCGCISDGDGEKGMRKTREKTNHVRVKMENCDWLIVSSLQGSKGWECDGVVAAEGDEFGVDV